MNRVVVNAWFCDKCHGYNKMKEIPVPMKSGTIFNSREECRRCGKVQHCEVKVDYWNDREGEVIPTIQQEGKEE